MRIAIGSDPNAESAKIELIKHIEKGGYGEVVDFGSPDPIYANTAIQVAESVAKGEYDKGILICGTGIGAVSYTHLDVYKRQGYRYTVF